MRLKSIIQMTILRQSSSYDMSSGLSWEFNPMTKVDVCYAECLKFNCYAYFVLKLSFQSGNLFGVA